MHSKRPKIAALTQGSRVPSTRFRWQQYAPDLVAAGLDVHELQSNFGAYPPISKIQRPFWGGASVVENLIRVLRSNFYDVRFVQRNLMSTLCVWEPLLREPFVFDVDDAIFLGARGSSADRIARLASVTICGNSFLADHFSKMGRVVILPTAVDTLRFTPGVHRSCAVKVIGWSGSSSGLKYLYGIESAILTLMRKHADIVLKVVSDRPPEFKALPVDRVVYEPWSPDREVAVLQEFDVGVMPLEDDLWARGKCSFKMLTYMAVGIPVVVSPVGMNSEILMQADCGFGPKNMDEWVNAISSIIYDQSLAQRLGGAGRKLVESRYARNVISSQLTSIIRSNF